jgi:hypothetical protein
MSEIPGAGLARDAEMLTEAAENAGTLLVQLQAQITALQTVCAQHDDTIARLYAATQCHACPGGCEITHDDGELHPANIGECVKAGLCHCEVGHILNAQTWSPTL